MRNLAQRVNSGYFPREEFRISARPCLACSEALASVEINFIFVLRESLSKARRVRININLAW